MARIVRFVRDLLAPTVLCGAWGLSGVMAGLGVLALALAAGFWIFFAALAATDPGGPND